MTRRNFLIFKIICCFVDVILFFGKVDITVEMPFANLAATRLKNYFSKSKFKKDLLALGAAKDPDPLHIKCFCVQSCHEENDPELPRSRTAKQIQSVAKQFGSIGTVKYETRREEQAKCFFIKQNLEKLVNDNKPTRNLRNP
jgi:hypothetical protein